MNEKKENKIYCMLKHHIHINRIKRCWGIIKDGKCLNCGFDYNTKSKLFKNIKYGFIVYGNPILDNLLECNTDG